MFSTRRFLGTLLLNGILLVPAFGFCQTAKEAGIAKKASIYRFLGISPDFKVYATEGETKRVGGGHGVNLIDLESGRQITSPEWDSDWGHARSVVFGKNLIAVTCAGKGYSSNGNDGSDSIKIFSRKSGELERNIRIPGLGDVNHGLGFLGIIDENHLVLRLPYSRSALVHDISVKKLDYTSMGNRRGECRAFSDKHIIAYETEDVRGQSRIRQISIVETRTGKAVKSLKEFPKINQKESETHRYSPAAIRTEGDLLAYGVEDTVALYDVAADKIVHRLEGHLDIVTNLVFSPSGQIVASAGKDKSIRFWNVKDGKELYAIKKLSFVPANLLFSSDGKRIAILSSGYSVHAEIVNIEAETKTK